MSEQEREEFKEYGRRLKIILIILLIVFLISSLVKSCKEEKRIKETEKLNITLKESLKISRNKEGNLVGRIGVLQTENVKYFKDLAITNQEVIKLQKLVDKYKANLGNSGSALILETQGTVNTTSPTIITSTLSSNYPTYTSSFNKGDWVKGTIIANKDSISSTFSFKESIDVVIGEEKSGFLGLGKRKPFAEVTLHNPYNELKTLRAYSKTPLKQKRINIGPTLMYGIGPNFNPGVFIGVGGTWGIINF